MRWWTPYRPSGQPVPSAADATCASPPSRPSGKDAPRRGVAPDLNANEQAGTPRKGGRLFLLSCSRAGDGRRGICAWQHVVDQTLPRHAASERPQTRGQRHRLNPGPPPLKKSKCEENWTLPHLPLRTLPIQIAEVRHTSPRFHPPESRCLSSSAVDRPAVPQRRRLSPYGAAPALGLHFRLVTPLPG